MSARHFLLTIQRGGSDMSEWMWFFSARNGRELARSSETYRRKTDCVHGAAMTLGIEDVLTSDGWSVKREPYGPVRVRVIA